LLRNKVTQRHREYIQTNYCQSKIFIKFSVYSVWCQAFILLFSCLCCFVTRDGILGHHFNKRLESFAQCHSQALKMADFKENHTLI
jgi:hypothetical protein